MSSSRGWIECTDRADIKAKNHSSMQVYASFPQDISLVSLSLRLRWIEWFIIIINDEY